MSELVESLLATPARASSVEPESPTSHMIRSVRAGVPFSRAEKAFGILHLSLDEAAGFLGLATRTLHRRKAARQNLDPVESEKVLRLMRIADAASETLGDRVAAGEWLRTPNVALGSQIPLSMLDTDVGASAVLDVLVKLEQGVWS